MAIEISSERLLTPAQAAKLLPTRRRGRPIHLSTIHRWMAIGIRGVRLESLRIGGALHTSTEALQRFSDRLTATDEPVRSTGHRRPQADRVESALVAEGL